jgi:hypothetical protein
MKNNILNFSTLTALFLFAATLQFQSCKPKNSDGQEEITTIKLKLTSLSNGTQVFNYQNLNGAVNKDTIKVFKSDVYTCDIQLLDETKNPANDVTDEIKSKANEHQFFFVSSPSGMILFSDFDKDGNGKDVGLTSKWTVANNAQTGTVKIVLKHLDGNPKTGNMNDGETDIEVVFDAMVQ